MFAVGCYVLNCVVCCALIVERCPLSVLCWLLRAVCGVLLFVGCLCCLLFDGVCGGSLLVVCCCLLMCFACRSMSIGCCLMFKCVECCVVDLCCLLVVVRCPLLFAV